VAQVGDGVDPTLSGTRVVAHTGNEGGYADRIVVPADGVSIVPDGLDLSVAAALLHDGPTALALFDITKVGRDDTLVVVGASGGLGILSLQLGQMRAATTVALFERETGADPRLDPTSSWTPISRTGSSRSRRRWPEAERMSCSTTSAGPWRGGSFGLGRGRWAFSAHGTPSGRFAQIRPAGSAARWHHRHGHRGRPDVARRPEAYTELAPARGGRRRDRARHRPDLPAR